CVFPFVTPRPRSPTPSPYTTLFRARCQSRRLENHGLGGPGVSPACLLPRHRPSRATFACRTIESGGHPGFATPAALAGWHGSGGGRKRTRLKSSHLSSSDAVFCLQK